MHKDARSALTFFGVFLSLLVLIAAIGVGAWWFFTHFAPKPLVDRHATGSPVITPLPSKPPSTTAMGSASGPETGAAGEASAFAFMGERSCGNQHVGSGFRGAVANWAG